MERISLASKRKIIFEKLFQRIKTDDLVQLFVSVSLNCFKQQDVLKTLENMQQINRELKTKPNKAKTHTHTHIEHSM